MSYVSTSESRALKTDKITIALTCAKMEMRAFTMDFVVGLSRTKNQCDAVWVIVDKSTKSAHFLSIQMTDLLDKLARWYIHEIVRLMVPS